jgi:hypothetical protein
MTILIFLIVWYLTGAVSSLIACRYDDADKPYVTIGDFVFSMTIGGMWGLFTTIITISIWVYSEGAEKIWKRKLF